MFALDDGAVVKDGVGDGVREFGCKALIGSSISIWTHTGGNLTLYMGTAEGSEVVYGEAPTSCMSILVC